MQIEPTAYGAPSAKPWKRSKRSESSLKRAWIPILIHKPLSHCLLSSVKTLCELKEKATLSGTRQRNKGLILFHRVKDMIAWLILAYQGVVWRSNKSCSS